MATAAEPRPGPAPAPPPPPPPEHAHAQPKDKEKDKSDYYGYLYEANKTPTKTFDALLRAIAKHVIDNLGDKKDKALKPSKLAAFYKAVGGDYDKLFVHAPHESISYIWQVFGCRHTLEPTDSDDDAPWNFEPPTIPAVTLRGFVRWESIQILLTPEEHVPFILYAVQHWNLRHPDTGEPFPPAITAASFPTEPDAEISAWYESCGEKLRKEATPKATPSPRPAFPSSASSTHHDRVHAAFSHVRAPGRTATPDYFSHHRSVPFTHVSPGHATRHTPRGGVGSSNLRGSPERAERIHRYSGGGGGGMSSSQEERARRRSFSDYPSPHASPHEAHASSSHLNPPRPTATRRHSHPRRVSPDPDDSDSDSDGGNASPRAGRYSSRRSPRVVPRFVHIAVPSTGPPSGHTPPIPNAAASSPLPHIRTDGGGAKLRPSDGISPGGGRVSSSGARKSGVEGAKDFLKDKLTSIFPIASPSDPRVPSSRKSPGSNAGATVGGGGSRDSLGRARSYDDGSGESDSELERERRRRRRARERERREREAAAYEREQQRAARRSREDVGGGGGSAEWEDGVGRPGRAARKDRSDKEKERYLRRPENPRRTSSHADVDRLERERMHRYDYAAADGANGSRRPGGLRGRGGRPLEEDDLRGGGPGPRDRTASPVIKGVGGRRYPAPPESPDL